MCHETVLNRKQIWVKINWYHLLVDMLMCDMWYNICVPTLSYEDNWYIWPRLLSSSMMNIYKIEKIIEDQRIITTFNSLLLQRTDKDRLGIPRLSAQNLTEGSSGTTMATVLDFREHPCTNIWFIYLLWIYTDSILDRINQ